MRVCDFVCQVMAEEITAARPEGTGCIVGANVDLQSCTYTWSFVSIIQLGILAKRSGLIATAT